MKHLLPILVLLLVAGAIVHADPAYRPPVTRNQSRSISEGGASDVTPIEEKRQARSSLMKIGKAVDRMAADVEEYGTVSISAPLLTLPTKRLWFNLSNTADQYYTNARTEVAGRAFAATAIAQSLGIDVQATADLDQLAAARAIRQQIAPQQSRNSELQSIQLRRAELAYVTKKKELPEGATDAQKLANEEAALAAKAAILKEPSGATDPTFPSFDSSKVGAVSSAAPGQTITANINGGSEEQAKDAAGNVTGTTAKSGTNVTVTTTGQPSAVAPRVDPDLVAATAIAASHTSLGSDGQAFLGGEIKLPDLDAVKSAEAAHSLQGLMNFFHYPVEAMQFQDKVVMMAVVTVGVSPGWRTAKDFAGEVTMENKYRYVQARREVVARMVKDTKLPFPLRKHLATDYQISMEFVKESSEVVLSPKDAGGVGSGGSSGGDSDSDYVGALSGPARIPDGLNVTTESIEALEQKRDWFFLDGKTPVVSGISPLSQTDTLDLASEFKRQDQFALALAATLQMQGAKGSAKVFEQWVKSQRKDVQTRSVSATVGTYSRAGGVVGFQIGPRLRALADPASRKNKSGFVLERQAFPALLVYGIDAADIYPRIAYHADKSGKFRYFVYEAKIENQQHSYWRPLTYRYQGPKDWFNPFKAIWPPVWWEAAQKQTTVLDRNLRLHDALYDAVEVLPRGDDEGDRREQIYKEAKAWQERGLELKQRYFISYNNQYLPAEVLVPSVLLADHLPNPPPPAPNPPQVQEIFPDALEVIVPKVGEAFQFEQGGVQKVAILGRGFNHVQAISCRPVGAVELGPVGAVHEGLTTQIGDSSILMFLRVRAAGAVTFQLQLSPDAFGPAAESGAKILFTPPVILKVTPKTASTTTSDEARTVQGLADTAIPSTSPIAPKPVLPAGQTKEDPALAVQALPLFPDEMVLLGAESP